MLYRLVRPMRRKGSRNAYFVQRIPSDVKAQAVGLRLAIPVGDTTHHVQVGAHAKDIRFSLRAADPSEVKVRQAAAAAYLERMALDHPAAKLPAISWKASLSLRLALDHPAAKLRTPMASRSPALRLALDHPAAKLLTC